MGFRKCWVHWTSAGKACEGGQAIVNILVPISPNMVISIGGMHNGANWPAVLSWFF